MMPELRKAELYTEMKDISKIEKILGLKKDIFAQRGFQLRMLVLNNLLELVTMQLRALDEAYNLLGLDKEAWTDENHMLHDLDLAINEERRKKQIESALKIEKREENQSDRLERMMRTYIDLLYRELTSIHLEDLFKTNQLMKKEQELVDKIGKIIKMESNEENRVLSKI